LLHTQLLTKLGKIMIQAQSLEIHYLDVIKSHVAETESSFKALDPSKEQEIFIDHNVSPFSAPADWAFEPCSVHYDTVSFP
jgi:formin-binding protein 1